MKFYWTFLLLFASLVVIVGCDAPAPTKAPAATPAASTLKFESYKDTKSEWRWRLIAANNRIVADSGESYKNRVDCVSAIELVKKDAPGAPVSSK